MNIDTELDAWRKEWQSAEEVTPDLRRKVERQSRWMRLGIAGDLLVTVTMGGGTIALAFRTPKPDMIVLAAATWGFLAAAWTFVLAANRGLWRPAAVDTRTFVNLAIARCRARIAGAKFGAGLLICELAFCAGWLYHAAREPKRPLIAWLLLSSTVLDAVWVGTLVFLGLLVWYIRRKRAELARLESMRQA